MKVTVDPHTEAEPKTDIQLQDEALQRDKTKSADTEKIILKQHELSKALSQPAQSTEPRAHELKKVLGGSFDDRIKEDKVILITLRYGQRADVIFTGFWNGKLVSNAMNAVSRAYRVQKHKTIRANATQSQGVGDARD